MGRPSAEVAGPGPPRVAIVGAQSAAGTALRERLAEVGIPGAQVDLYGSASGDALLSEYDGEARLIQAPELDDVAGHRVVFLCETGAPALALAQLAGAETVVIDVCGVLAEDPALPLVGHDADSDEQPRDAAPGLWRLPHPAAAMLSDVLRPLQQAHDICGVSAVLLTPAADHGQAGLDELRDQTVGLLGFASWPKAVFGAQLAFNLIPQQRMPVARDLARRVAAETERLLGWHAPTLALQLVNAPVFHGHAAALHVRFSGDVTPDQLRQTLGERFDAESGGTPFEAAGRRQTVVVDIESAGAGVWLWVVAGEVGAIPAELAVRLACRWIGA